MSKLCGISHVAVVTADLDGYRAFYEGTIGLETALLLAAGPGHGRQATVFAGDAMLHVFEVADARRGGRRDRLGDAPAGTARPLRLDGARRRRADRDLVPTRSPSARRAGTSVRSDRCSPSATSIRTGSRERSTASTLTSTRRRCETRTRSSTGAGSSGPGTPCTPATGRPTHEGTTTSTPGIGRRRRRTAIVATATALALVAAAWRRFGRLVVGGDHGSDGAQADRQERAAGDRRPGRREVVGAGRRGAARVWTPQELLAIAYAQPPMFAPAAEYYYSNTNYVLLGLIIEQLDGKSLAASFEDRLCGPSACPRRRFPPPPRAPSQRSAPRWAGVWHDVP